MKRLEQDAHSWVSKMADYYTQEAIENLAGEIENLTGAILYLKDLKPGEEDFGLLEELTPYFDEVAGAMEDFFCHYVKPKEE